MENCVKSYEKNADAVSKLFPNRCFFRINKCEPTAWPVTILIYKLHLIRITFF